LSPFESDAAVSPFFDSELSVENALDPAPPPRLEGKLKGEEDDIEVEKLLDPVLLLPVDEEDEPLEPVENGFRLHGTVEDEDFVEEDLLFADDFLLVAVELFVD
jgi:hypothetical protein